MQNQFNQSELDYSIYLLHDTCHTLFYYALDLAFCDELFKTYEVLDEDEDFGGPIDMLLTLKDPHARMIAKFLLQAKPIAMTLARYNHHDLFETDGCGLNIVKAEHPYNIKADPKAAYPKVIRAIADFLETGLCTWVALYLSSIVENDPVYARAVKTYEKHWDPRRMMQGPNQNITLLAEFVSIYNPLRDYFFKLARKQNMQQRIK